MCGRFTRTVQAKDLTGLFELAEAASLPPSYNVAPTQPVAAVRIDPDSANRELAALRWGLVPSYRQSTATAGSVPLGSSEDLTIPNTKTISWT
jgi:putative SOS response-associated peptidase YedK